MCEWLSHGEWCDVKLLCGGRSFSAHRVVLASVSKFLERILLSCPVDETPTFIVLPDFDLEAISSVLYYIYNGEVTVEYQKLGMFLDIIHALQIYIDSQFLPNLKDNVGDGRYCFNTLSDQHFIKSNVFTLGCSDEKDQKVFNIRRGSDVQNMLLQYSQNDLDFEDNVVRCQNGSELRKSHLGNLKSPYTGRQRNSFLRDLFIETYPRNGNVNGLTEGVLAISNECYRSPASVLSTNANVENLNKDDVLLRCFKNTTERALVNSTMFQSDQQLQSASNYIGTCGFQARNSVSSCINYCPINTSKMPFINSSKMTDNFSSDGMLLLPQQMSEQSLLSGLHTSLDLRRSIFEAMKNHLIFESKYAVPQSSVLKCDSFEKNTFVKSHSSAKVIFNQVLENPWNARTPNNYKPFRRKDVGVDIEKLQKIDTVNDNNNNIETSSTKSIESHKLKQMEPADLNSTVAMIRDCFKCAHCNQVFTSSDSLSVHMRRHSINARYTCNECGKTFSQLRNFKYHMSIHRGTREFAATCTVCGKYFNDRGYLSSHMKIHRNRKEYKCALCPKSFNQRVAYNMHVRIHTGVKPHVCEECGKAFSRKMLLKQHQRTHSGERPYACPHCDKRFADRSNMTLHLRLHTGIKPFSCTLCPKSFTKKHHLKSHLNFHTGSKPYSCPRCKLAFTQSSNMRTHLKKCTAPDPSSGIDSQSHL